VSRKNDAGRVSVMMPWAGGFKCRGRTTQAEYHYDALGRRLLDALGRRL